MERSSRQGIGLRMSFYNAKGAIGVFLRLDMASIMRNKNLRKTFTSAVAINVFICILLAFTTLYSERGMQIYWLYYCSSLFPAMLIVKIMCYEGNYIDCLMVHKESIYNLLRAKYYFICFLQLLPFLLLLPTVFTHVYTIGELLSFMFLGAGLVNFIYFQLAVYNKETATLNTKAVGKGGTRNNFTQMLVSLVVFLVPVPIIMVIENAAGKEITCIVLSIIGLTFILTNKLWLKNIYKRMMARKYANMESFHATRTA